MFLTLLHSKLTEEEVQNRKLKTLQPTTEDIGIKLFTNGLGHYTVLVCLLELEEITERILYQNLLIP